jgi:DnaJ-class molecular chaperone
MDILKNKSKRKEYTPFYKKIYIIKIKMPDYYNILGVSRDASEQEIKKAYRTMSLKFHPDRNSSEEAKSKMLEINAAYEVLGDEGKKRNYDMGGTGDDEGPGGFPFGPGGMGFSFGGPGGMGGHPFAHMHSMNEFTDINDLLNMMGGMGMGGMGMGGMGMGGMSFGGPGGPSIRIFRGGVPVVQKPEPIRMEINITLEQAYYGVPEFSITIDRVVVVQHIQSQEQETMKIAIPTGINTNEAILLQDKGHVIQDKVKGDVHVIIKVQENATFVREGMDLHFKKTISLKECLCGFSCEIPHINGKMLRLNHSGSSHVIKPGEKKTIPGYGMVKNRGQDQEGSNTGNLVVTFEVTFPDKLSEDQITAIQEIL